MANSDIMLARRVVLAALVGTGILAPLGISARAQAGIGLGGLLGTASDHALDKLSQPGGFYNDTAVRIAMPGIGNSAGGGGLLGGAASLLGNVSGLDGMTHKLNDAAGNAAHAAKPVFRAAISRLSLKDVPGILKRSDGGTQFLRQSAGGELHDKIRPLIDAAMVALGAYHQFDQLNAQGGLLAKLGLSHDKLGNSVTEQALGGIYKYMGAEEGKLRANPMSGIGGAASALGSIKF